MRQKFSLSKSVLPYSIIVYAPCHLPSSHFLSLPWAPTINWKLLKKLKKTSKLKKRKKDAKVWYILETLILDILCLLNWLLVSNWRPWCLQLMEVRIEWKNDKWTSGGTQQKCTIMIWTHIHHTMMKMVFFFFFFLWDLGI